MTERSSRWSRARDRTLCGLILLALGVVCLCVAVTLSWLRLGDAALTVITVFAIADELAIMAGVLVAAWGFIGLRRAYRDAGENSSSRPAQL